MNISDYFNLEELDVYTFMGNDITIIDAQLGPGDSYYHQMIKGTIYIAVTKGTVIIGNELVKVE